MNLKRLMTDLAKKEITQEEVDKILKSIDDSNIDTKIIKSKGRKK